MVGMSAAVVAHGTTDGVGYAAQIRDQRFDRFGREVVVSNESRINFGDVSRMMFAMMYLHGACIDMRLQCTDVIWQRGKFVCHVLYTPCLKQSWLRPEALKGYCSWRSSQCAKPRQLRALCAIGQGGFWVSLGLCPYGNRRRMNHCKFYTDRNLCSFWWYFAVVPAQGAQPRLLYRARLKFQDLRGQAHLELCCHFPGQGEFS